MTRDEMISLTQNTDNLSEKIRILDRAGVAKADIARFVERRYQHIYNVLLRPKPPHESAGHDQASPGDEPEVLRVTVDKNGSVKLPPAWAEAQGLQPGSTLYCRAAEDGLHIMSRDAAIAALRESARRAMPEQAALLEALLAGNKE